MQKLEERSPKTEESKNEDQILPDFFEHRPLLCHPFGPSDLEKSQNRAD